MKFALLSAIAGSLLLLSACAETGERVADRDRVSCHIVDAPLGSHVMRREDCTSVSTKPAQAAAQAASH